MQHYPQIRTARRRVNSRLSPAALALIGAVLFTSPAVAKVPTSMTVQGGLYAKSGGPVADGKYKILFGLWNAEKSGSMLWSEEQTVDVAKGEFSVVVGEAKPVSPTTVAGADSVWLSVRVESEAEMPRKRIHSTAFAMVADTAMTAHALQCTGCVAWSAMNDSGDIKLLKGSLTVPVVKAGSVIAGEFVGDGSKLTGLKSVAGTCSKVGEVVKGVNADGTLVCAASMDPSGLPKDGLDEISNGLLTNQFTDKFASANDTPIPDAKAGGVQVSIDVGDVGIAQGLKVTVNLTNSDLSTLRIQLFDPTDKSQGYVLCEPCAGTGVCVPCGSKGDGFNVKPFAATYPDPTATKTGDLGKWIGQNAKGKWDLLVTDTGKRVDTKTDDGVVGSWQIDLLTLSSKKVGVTKALSFADGTQMKSLEDAVPTGAVMAFKLAKCPPGWSILGAAQGRVLVGLPAGGTLDFTYGSSLTDKTGRFITDVPAHTHSIDPPSTNTNSTGAHAHTVRVGGGDWGGNFGGVADSDSGEKGTRNTNNTGAHTHSVDIVAFSSASSGKAQVDVTMPYLQLLYCIKQ